jgi:hypothetical protein
MPGIAGVVRKQFDGREPEGLGFSRLASHEAAMAALLAVDGDATPENSLRLYDVALEQLNLAGSQAGVLNSVAADKAVRDQAQDEAQRVARRGPR